MYKVCYRDTDPDTGYEGSEYVIAQCHSQRFAEWVLRAIEFDYHINAADPNRRFYIIS